MLRLLTDLVVVSFLAVLLPVTFLATVQWFLVAGPWILAHVPHWLLAICTVAWLLGGRKI